jgi:type IVB pilus formation R64 PilN family outer membrane protein
MTLRFKFASPLIVLVAVALSVAGCSTYQAKEQVKADLSDVTARAQREQERVQDLTNNYYRNRDALDEVGAPWLAGKSIPLARDVTLPPALRANVKVSAVSSACMSSTLSLPTLASCITLATGIPVRVKPDALLPVSQFAPRRGSSGPATAPPSSAAASATSGQQGGMAIGPVDIQVGTLLDLADAAWGVSHRVTESGQIEIFRIETKVLRLKALAQKVTNLVSTSAGFSAESKSTYESTATDALVNMHKTLLAMGTVAGDVVINPESKSVIVTDTSDAIARMQTYIDDENKRLTRRVTLVFEELFVTSKQQDQASVDWSVLYDKLIGTANTFSSPATLAGSAVGSAGFSVRGTGAFSGTSVILRALDEMGLTVTRRSFPVSTLNGNTATVGLPTVFDYVAQVSNTAVTSTTGTISAPSITQKEDKYGAFLTVTPEAQDDGQVLVSVNLQDRTGTLTPYTVEVQGSGTTVQQRNIQESNLSGRTVLRVGVTHLIGGLDENASQSTARRLDAHAPMILGGSDSVTQSKRRIILLVTAVAEDNI